MMTQITFNRWRRVVTVLGIACGVLTTMMAGLASAQNPTRHTASDTLPLRATSALSRLTYARVLTGGVPVYEHPSHAVQGAAPVRTLSQGYVWVTLASAQPLLYGQQHWYAINVQEYVPADQLEIYRPSSFQGVELAAPRSFAWIVFDTYTAPAPGQLPDENTILLTRYSTVTIEETQTVDEQVWYRVGPDQWIEQGMVGLVEPKPRPQGIGPSEKWIEVNLFEQTLAAYEGDRMVYATLVSSGLPWWQTEPGLFRIWVKVDRNKMSGRDGYPDYYFLEDVPWTMYFNRDFALHGAYWHDRFGIKHSHGCVNLSLADARWLFHWSAPQVTPGWTLPSEDDPGTWVWVHE